MLGRFQATRGIKKNCISEINKSSTLHELQLSELAKKFNVRNKNGTLNNLLVFTENIN